LLPDGRVFVGGGNDRVQNSFHVDWDYNIYSPHYLQGDPGQGIPPPLRPTVLTILGPNVTVVDGAFVLPPNPPLPAPPNTFTLVCADILGPNYLDKIVLMAPGSITHHSDMSARYVELPSQAVTGSTVKRTFQTPNSSMLPRGFYMMFALNSIGTPSVAAWVKIT